MTMPDIPAALDRRVRPPAAGKPLVYTFSNLKNYRTCPEQFAQRYVHKSLPFVESDAMKRGNAVHAALEARLGAGKPLPDDMAVWERWAAPFDGRKVHVEQRLAITASGAACDFWDAAAWLRGKLDLWMASDYHAFLLDWKYKEDLSKIGQYEDPFELEIGALLLSCNEGQRRKIIGHYCYETGLSQPYDLSDVKGTLLKVREIAKDIERDLAAQEWEKKRSGLCKAWCDVLTCEHNGKRT